MTAPSLPRSAAALLILLSLALSACLLAPGRFTSALDVRRDGQFSFSYTGEIHMLPLSKLANNANAAETFEPSPCRDEGEQAVERACTPKEIASQRKSFDEERERAAESRRREAESMKAFLGGIDPSSPRAAEELAQRLRRQAGWRKVVYKGDGLFEVDFAISGRLDRDFTFPTMERFPLANAFVQISLRNDGRVRIDAPGFGPASSGEPFRGLMQGMAAKDTMAKGDAIPGFPQVDGRFVVRTDGQILANNTDEGPLPDALGQRLDWTVNLRSAGAPTALIKLAP